MFTYIRRTISAILELGQAAVEALQGIQAAITIANEELRQLQAAVSSDPSESEALAIAAIQAKMADLTMAVDTGVIRVQRSENRIRAIVQGARKQLAEQGLEHAGVEAEASELHDVDGGGSDDQPVPPVPEDLVDDGDRPSSIPGVTVGQLRRSFLR